MQSIKPTQLVEQFQQAWSNFVAKPEGESEGRGKAIATWFQQAWATVSGPQAIQLYKLALKSLVYLLCMLVYLVGALLWLLSILLLTAATALNQEVNGAESLPQFPLTEQDADAIATVRVSADEKVQAAQVWFAKVQDQVKAKLPVLSAGTEKGTPAVAEVPVDLANPVTTVSVSEEVEV